MRYKFWTVTVKGKDRKVQLSWLNSWESLKLEVDGRKVRNWYMWGLWGPDSYLDFKVVGVSVRISATWELYLEGKLVAPPPDRRRG